MTTEINSQVPISLHPSALDGLPAPEGLGDTMARLYSTASRYHEAVGKIARDSSLTESGQVHESEQLRERTYKAMNREFDTALSQVRSAIRLAEVRLDTATTPTRKDHAREIRSHLKAMRSSEGRIGFILSRAAAGDAETVHAALDGPDYLSGLDGLKAEDRATLLNEARRRLAPEAAAELDSMHKLDERITRAMSQAVKAYGNANAAAAGIAQRQAERKAAVAAV